MQNDAAVPTKAVLWLMRYMSRIKYNNFNVYGWTLY